MNYVKSLIVVISFLIFKQCFAIWNGYSESDLNDYQYMVSIQSQYVKSGTWTHWCGGSLINPKFILTAGHCIADDNGNPKSINSVKIFNRKGEDVFIKNFYLKPNFYWQFVSDFGFNYSIPENDLALIELINPITDENIVKLPSLSDAPFYYTPSREVLAIGYGWFDMRCDLKQEQYCGVSYPMLRSAKLFILPNSEMKWKDFYSVKASAANPYFYASSFVGVFSDTQAPTAHDSGSPLLFHNVDGSFTIIGSFTTSINYPQFFQPSIYTKIATDENLSWINNILTNY